MLRSGLETAVLRMRPVFWEVINNVTVCSFGAEKSKRSNVANYYSGCILAMACMSPGWELPNLKWGVRVRVTTTYDWA